MQQKQCVGSPCLVAANFGPRHLDYAMSVIVSRAIPDLRDG
jgi:DNA gyrase/topoisomerase IV subunit A